MSLAVVHHPAFDARFDEAHRFPMSKFTRLAEVLVEDGIVAPGGFHTPAPVDADILERAHDPHYVRQVLAAAVPPEIEKAIGFPVDARVSQRSRCACGGTLLTARLALEQGVACNTAGGSHHASAGQGAGFSVFNDVAVAAAELLDEGTLGRVLVFDCDVHQGDGTARIFANDPAVVTVSIHAANNYPVEKATSDLDVPLPDGMQDEAYLAALRATLADPQLSGAFDLVFYNAGVDPHRDDRLGRLSLSDVGLAERDQRVLGHFLERDVPVACVIGGGYSRDIEALSRRHTIVHRVASEFSPRR